MKFSIQFVKIILKGERRGKGKRKKGGKERRKGGRGREEKESED